MLTPVNFANKKVITLSMLAEDNRSHFLLRHVFGLLEWTGIHCRLSAGSIEVCADLLNTCSPKSFLFLICKYPDKLNA